MSEEAEDSGDKPFEATPERIKQARKKGQIAKSTDLITAGAYLGFWIAVMGFGAGALRQIAQMLASLIDQADTMSGVLTAPGGAPAALGLITKVVTGFGPIILVPMALALLAILAQMAFVVTPSNLVPKLSRINPISTAKQKFGRSGLFEFAKSTAKLCLYSAVLGLFLRQNTDQILATLLLDPGQILARMLALCGKLLGIVVLIALSLGGVDLLWQRAEFARRNRMSLQEMKDETKQSEGDPEFKHQRRQKGQEIALNQMLADVPNADVVIVNPTHYAVALAWDRASGAAPTCVAKGVDEIAAAIRDAANKAHIPIHSDPPTARALHAALDIGDQIPREHYMAVAAAIRFADEMRHKAKER